MAAGITPSVRDAELNHRLITGHTIIIRPDEDEDPEALFESICNQFDNQKIEQDAEGNVRIVPPVGGESSYQNCELSAHLKFWATRDGRGRAFDSSACFRLPDGSKLSPDASWVSVERLKQLSHDDRRKFPKLVPEFVVEIKSPTDRWTDLQRKMQDYRRNGVQLGWLIHPDKQIVHVYRNGTEDVQVLQEPDMIQGDGPVAGFVLDLRPIWKGLQF
jgi:Uma2 family endonuclease